MKPPAIKTYKTYIEIAMHDSYPGGMVEVEAESIWEAAQNRTLMLNQAIEAGQPGMQADLWYILTVTGPSLFAGMPGERDDISSVYFIIPRDCEMTDESPMKHDDEAMRLGLVSVEEVYPYVPGVRAKTFPE
jgi:hypothetical protein